MLELHPRMTHGGEVVAEGKNRWRLVIPPGPAGVYRWAQLDDHLDQRRIKFAWQAPSRLVVRARVSRPMMAGTWGFGFWNDPFSLSFRISGAARRLPAMPNAAWFFFASPENYLAFHDEHPAHGFLAATFSSVKLPAPLLALGLPFLPLLGLPFTARPLRRLAGLFIRDAGTVVPVDVTTWHTYQLDWLADRVVFFLDGQKLYETPVSPRGKLGLVVWVDNQYAAFPPNGKLRAGLLSNPEELAMEIENLEIYSL